MIEINYFDKKTTCCFTGHRVLKKDFNYEKLDETIETLIKKGYRTFLVGMAIGFDIECAKILLNKRKYNIDIVACIPCREQQKYFNKKQEELGNLNAHIEELHLHTTPRVYALKQLQVKTKYEVI